MAADEGMALGKVALTLGGKRSIPSTVLALATRIARSSGMAARLVRGSFWMAVGAVAARGCSVLVSVVVARALGQEGFGQYSMVLSTTALFTSFAVFGMGTTSTRYLAELGKKDAARAWSIACMSVAFAVVMGIVFTPLVYFLAPTLARAILNAPQLAVLLRVGALSLTFGSLVTAQMGILSGIQDFRAVAFGNVGRALLLLIIVPVLVRWKGLFGAVLGTVIVAVVSAFIFGVLVQRRAARLNVKLAGLRWWHEWRVLWEFSLPAAMSAVMVGPMGWWCNTVLARQPDGYLHLAVFSAADQWRQAVLFLPGLMSGVALPLMAESWGSSGRTGLGRALSLNLRAVWITIAPVMVFLIGVSQVVMNWYGPGFRCGNTVLILLVLAAFLGAIENTAGQVIAAAGQMWLGFAMNVGWALALLGGVHFLVPALGAVGLACAYLLSYVAHAIWVGIFCVQFWDAGFLRRLGAAGVVTIGATVASVAVTQRFALGGPAVVAVAGCLTLMTGLLLWSALRSGEALAGSR